LSGAVAEQVVAAGKELLTKGIDKDYEYEADHLGVVLAARAGYNPYGLVAVMQKLQARAADASLALLFATHPHPTDRLGKLGEAMTPRMGALPEGLEPQIMTVSVKAPPARAGGTRTPSGVRAMQQEGESASSSAGTNPAPRGGMGLDPGNLLRGLMGR
jgi:predicted Zn-dependent protease